MPEDTDVGNAMQTRELVEEMQEDLDGEPTELLYHQRARAGTQRASLSSGEQTLPKAIRRASSQSGASFEIYPCGLPSPSAATPSQGHPGLGRAEAPPEAALASI